MDVMEHTAITDVVVLETVLEEVKHLSMAAYTRLRALINNPARRFFVLLNEHHRCEAAAGSTLFGWNVYSPGLHRCRWSCLALAKCTPKRPLENPRTTATTEVRQPFLLALPSRPTVPLNFCPPKL